MKEILLSGKHAKDRRALVDDEDFEELNKYKWYCNKLGYAYNAKHNTSMHRKILNINDSNIYVDHVDHNTLNNQKCNLRICNRTENIRNVPKTQKISTSKYKGVSKTKHCKYWRATINACQQINIGRFDSEIDAAEAYDFYAIKYHKEFACLNFPNKDYSNYEIKNRLPISTYHGVTKDRRRNKWIARIKYNNKIINIGSYNTEIEAAEHYDFINITKNINLNNINFPEKNYNNFIPIYINKKINNI